MPKGNKGRVVADNDKKYTCRCTKVYAGTPDKVYSQLLLHFKFCPAKPTREELIKIKEAIYMPVDLDEVKENIRGQKSKTGVNVHDSIASV